MKKMLTLLLVVISFVGYGQLPFVPGAAASEVEQVKEEVAKETTSKFHFADLATGDFWMGILDNVVFWLVEELLAIVILTIGFLVIMRILKITVNKIRKVSTNNMHYRYDDDQKHEGEKRIDTLMGIILSIGKIVFGLIYVLLLLGRFNVDLAPFIASAGILGLAIGFGAQELVRDFISGFFMLLEDQVRTGDVAIINGTGGKVEKIAMRTITLRDVSGVVHIFQNGKINSISNMTKGWSALVVEIGVAYKEDTDTVNNYLKEICEEMLADETYNDRLTSYEILGIDSFGDSAVNLLVKLTTKSGEQWALSREFRRRVKKVFDKEGVEIPFPHISIYAGEASKPIQITKNN